MVKMFFMNGDSIREDNRKSVEPHGKVWRAAEIDFSLRLFNGKTPAGGRVS